MLRGVGVGRIATYARWRTAGDFFAAFGVLTGTAVTSTDDINAEAARRSRGLIRTDYHVYEEVSAGAGAAA